MVPPTPTPVATTLILEMPDGSTLSAGYDNLTITYSAHVLHDTYLAIGYGKQMADTNMVSFAAGSTANNSVCNDLYATTYGDPPMTLTNAYTTDSITVSD